jgi:hypothetical protein
MVEQARYPATVSLATMPVVTAVILSQFFKHMSTQTQILLLGRMQGSPDDMESLVATCNSRMAHCAVSRRCLFVPCI